MQGRFIQRSTVKTRNLIMSGASSNNFAGLHTPVSSTNGTSLNSAFSMYSRGALEDGSGPPSPPGIKTDPLSLGNLGFTASQSLSKNEYDSAQPPSSKYFSGFVWKSQKSPIFEEFDRFSSIDAPMPNNPDAFSGLGMAFPVVPTFMRRSNGENPLSPAGAFDPLYPTYAAAMNPPQNMYAANSGAYPYSSTTGGGYVAVNQHPSQQHPAKRSSIKSQDYEPKSPSKKSRPAPKQSPKHSGANAPREKRWAWLQSHYKSRIVAKIKEYYDVTEKNKGHFSSCMDEVLQNTLKVDGGDWKHTYELLKLDDESEAKIHLMTDEIASIANSYNEQMASKLLTYKCSVCGKRGHNRRGCPSKDNGGSTEE